MTAEPIRVSATWLDRRERADAAARSLELVEELRRRCVPAGHWLIHDVACGSGSVTRWLAPLLPGPQHWVVHDRDADLLARVAVDVPDVTVETRLSDLTRLGEAEFAEATLITASALLDLLTADELTRLIDVCAGAGCPVLFTLSVTGRVELEPPKRLDRLLLSAFNAHQRRGGLLGPDAVDAAVEGFRRLGSEVIVRPSPWRLGDVDADLVVDWLVGWVDAACEQEPGLTAAADLYRRRRLREAAAGALAVTVGHADLLVLP